MIGNNLDDLHETITADKMLRIQILDKWQEAFAKVPADATEQDIYRILLEAKYEEMKTHAEDGQIYPEYNDYILERLKDINPEGKYESINEVSNVTLGETLQTVLSVPGFKFLGNNKATEGPIEISATDQLTFLIPEDSVPSSIRPLKKFLQEVTDKNLSKPTDIELLALNYLKKEISSRIENKGSWHIWELKLDRINKRLEDLNAPLVADID